MEATRFEYDLPESLIAQEPPASRDESRMLHLDRSSGAVVHGVFRDLPDRLRADDLLVINDTRVLAARLHVRNAVTGARVELLAVSPEPDGSWRCLARPARRARPGETYLPERAPELPVTVVRRGDAGEAFVRAAGDVPLVDILDRAGRVPLPPYIRRTTEDARLDGLDPDRYQTVFARAPGAVAAPTAGLHFTADVLDRIRGRGVEVRSVTLHVGPGTFRPVKTDQVEDHVMHRESFAISEETSEAVARARADGRRIVAVGTTVMRTLEAAALAGDGAVRPGPGATDLFIYPPFEFRVVGAMLTNFHLPRSTLLMLVCAFAGTDAVLAAYREAVAERYRFFSYGDCMFIA